MGGITTLVGVFFVLGAAILTKAANQQGVPGLGAVVGGTLAVIAVVVLVIGIVEIVGGVGVWRGSGWGRVVGLIYGVLGLLLGLAITLDAATTTNGTRDGACSGASSSLPCTASSRSYWPWAGGRHLRRPPLVGPPSRQ